MKCPYCNIGIKLDVKGQVAYPNKDYSSTGLGYELVYGFCPECNEFVVMLRIGEYRWIDDAGELVHVQQEQVIFPKFSARTTTPEIPTEYRDAFNEANAVLQVSPKASAALSRRLLQRILREEYRITRRDLAKEIEDFIQLPNLPTEIANAVDAVRNVGNFAAHPLKYQSTGEIVDVEIGEAEWLLDVLEALFDFTFVQPRRAQNRRDELNKKLAALGKAPMMP